MPLNNGRDAASVASLSCNGAGAQPMMPDYLLASTPAFHHCHHTSDAHRDRNLAGIFHVLARLFGTLYLPKTCRVISGIYAAMSPSLAGQLLDPIVERTPAARPRGKLFMPICSVTITLHYVGSQNVFSGCR